MGNKKIKKSAQPFTLTTVVITVILAIGIFQGIFPLIDSSVEAGGGTIDPRYQQSYDRLNSSTQTLDSNIDDIKNNLKDVGEADNTFQVAWNGLKGLGNTLKLPISFIDTAIDSFTSFTGFGIIPDWAKLLIEVALVGALVFLVLSVLKGEPRT